MAKNKEKLILKKPLDFTLLITVFILLGLGIITVLSASSPTALAETGNSYKYFEKQMLSAGIGIVLMIGISKVDYKCWQKNYKVIICDQLEDPKATKKLVKRGITELVTPGVAINDNVLSYKENNFLAAVHFGKTACGIAFLDISTIRNYKSRSNYILFSMAYKK